MNMMDICNPINFFELCGNLFKVNSGRSGLHQNIGCLLENIPGFLNDVNTDQDGNQGVDPVDFKKVYKDSSYNHGKG